MSQSISRPLHSHETPSQIAKTGYDKHAQAYLDWTISKPSSRLTYLNRVIDLLSQRKLQHQNTSQTTAQSISVLDLGCGAGFPVTFELAKSKVVQHVISTDISRTQLELLQQKLHDDESIPAEKVKVIESDMLELSFKMDTLDAIVAFFSIIHLAREDQKVILKRIWNWLKPGGYFCGNFGANVGDTAAENTSSGNVVEGWLGMNAYWDGHGVDETKSILQDLGFELIVTDVVEEVDDATFLWIIAKKAASP